jgi:hypothetical protein
MNSDQLIQHYYFQTPVYMVKKPEFLPVVNAVSQRYIALSKASSKTKNAVMVMSGNYMHEPEIADFATYASQTAWNILSAQGYKMQDLVTYFTEMWTQEHNKTSYMETHVHGHGVQISGFYFLDVPEKSCKLVIHDPRAGKLLVNLHEENARNITEASHQIVFTPEPGLMIFMNSWVPHSLTKNLSRQPLRFVHMNISVAMNPTALEKINKGEVAENSKKIVDVL